MTTRRDQIAFGQSMAWARTAESGNALTFRFCPTCGSTPLPRRRSAGLRLAAKIGQYRRG